MTRLTTRPPLPSHRQRHMQKPPQSNRQPNPPQNNPLSNQARRRLNPWLKRTPQTSQRQQAKSVDEVAQAAESSADEAPQPESAAEESAESAEAASEPAKEDKPAEPQPKYQRGRVYQGKIVETSPVEVRVELDEGDIGIVPGRELELMTKKLLESLVVGAEVDVYVVNPRNHRGKTILSINHALEEADWRNARKFAKSKEVYEALIGGYNKGGLIVRFGRLRGFVPQSQLSENRARQLSGSTPEERYGPMVNQPIGVKVMEVDRKRNRLILSERAATREVRVKQKESLIAELSVGDIRKGVVVSLENFGAFVDIGGGEGTGACVGAGNGGMSRIRARC